MKQPINVYEQVMQSERLLPETKEAFRAAWEMAQLTKKLEAEMMEKGWDND